MVPQTPVPETAVITLPLDTVMEVLRAAKGSLSPETEGLMKVEVASVLCGLSMTDGDVKGHLRETFEV